MIFSPSILLRPFFSTALLSVNIDGRVCHVRVLTRKNGATKENFTKDFKCVGNELPIEAAKFIQSYKRKHPFTYLGAMSKTYNQGLISSLEKKRVADFGINASEYEFIKMNNWMCYIKRRAIDENRVMYLKALGIDYLFSPFIVMEQIIKKELTNKCVMYVLQERSSISIVVATKTNMLFGGYFVLGNDLDGDDSESTIAEVNNIFDLSSIKNVLGSSFEELQEIGELEDIDENVLRDELLPEMAEMQRQRQDKNSHFESLRELARAQNASGILTNCITEFYNNDLYDSDFLDKILILDTYGISEQAINHIQNALLLDVDVKRVDLGATLIEIMKSESR